MSLLKNLYYDCASLVPLQVLVKISPVTSFFPYYHIVSDEEVPHIKGLYSYKNVKQFNADLNFLLRHFDPIEPAKLISYVNEYHELPRKKFLLTFDDGFREAYEIVAPVLQSRGLPAIFFINPAFIDNKEMFYRNKISLIIYVLRERRDELDLLRKCASILGTSPVCDQLCQVLKNINQTNKNLADDVATALEIDVDEYLKTKRPWLSYHELQSLASRGFAIGAHSWDHPYYKYLPLEEQLQQTVNSCDFARKLMNNDNVSFSFPHSDEEVGQSFFDALQKVDGCPDLLFGVQNQKSELNNRMIHRFNAERPEVSMNRSVKGMLTYNLIQTIFSKQKVTRTYA